ncbi:MAG TPA: hypothetical protein VK158_00545 [Acidobacteriota bacterium]|nr:hypothetical protein [Acidobacteriota bacterium]
MEIGILNIASNYERGTGRKKKQFIESARPIPYEQRCEHALNIVEQFAFLNRLLYERQYKSQWFIEAAPLSEHLPALSAEEFRALMVSPQYDTLLTSDTVQSMIKEIAAARSFNLYVKLPYGGVVCQAQMGSMVTSLESVTLSKEGLWPAEAFTDTYLQTKYLTPYQYFDGGQTIEFIERASLANNYRPEEATDMSLTEDTLSLSYTIATSPLFSATRIAQDTHYAYNRRSYISNAFLQPAFIDTFLHTIADKEDANQLLDDAIRHTFDHLSADPRVDELVRDMHILLCDAQMKQIPKRLDCIHTYPRLANVGLFNLLRLDPDEVRQKLLPNIRELREKMYNIYTVKIPQSFVIDKQ